MSNPATPAPALLFASAAAPVAATSAINAPTELLNALAALHGAGYPGIYDANRNIAPDAKASFHLAVVAGVTVVAPSIKGTVSQLALASATLGMAGAQGATLAYNTSFARGGSGREEGIVPGVYGLILLCGDQAAVDALARRISEDHEVGAANARRTRASAAAPVAAPVAAPAASETPF
jgi:hypothetical protein